MPKHCTQISKRAIKADNVKEMCNEIIELCTKNEEKFIFAYNDNPDGILHKYGCKSKEVTEFILNAEQEFEKMLKSLDNTNTLVILSADHGHQDIKETIDILELTEIQEYLTMPAILEERMVGFFVKPNKRKMFIKTFNKIFKDKYILYPKEKLIKKYFLGYGNKHRKIDDFLGDYIAIAKSDTRISLGTHLSRELKKPHNYQSTHGGLTKNEMEIPLIIFEKTST